MPIDPTCQTVAATLRTIAEWVGQDPAHREGDRQELYDMADQVEHESALVDACCPVCQEVICDTNCPLAEIRGAAQRRS